MRAPTGTALSRAGGMALATSIAVAILLGVAKPAEAGLPPWSKYAGNPVLLPNPALGNRADPEVIQDGSVYKMWYSTPDSNFTEVLYATSTDAGVTWTEHGAVMAIGAPGAWDSTQVGEVAVLKDGATYKMWYTGYSDLDGELGRIGYATSSDGISWTKHAGNPVLGAGSAGSWDSRGVSEPTVVKVDGVYKMWFAGRNDDFLDDIEDQIGYATSSDGVSWTKHPGNPVLAVIPPTWESFEVDNPYVIAFGAGFLMWYGGDDGITGRIGYARSSDGIVWIRFPENPVLGPGPSGSWDSYAIDGPSVTQSGENLRMWYDGEQVTPTTEPSAIGLALPEAGGTLGTLAGVAVLLGLDRGRRRLH